MPEKIHRADARAPPFGLSGLLRAIKLVEKRSSIFGSSLNCRTGAGRYRLRHRPNSGIPAGAKYFRPVFSGSQGRSNIPAQGHGSGSLVRRKPCTVLTTHGKKG